MELHLDLDAIVVRLVGVDDLDRLDVVIDAPLQATAESHAHRLGDVIAARHLGVMTDTGRVAINPLVLEFFGAGGSSADWMDRVALMIEDAREVGRVDDVGRLRCDVRWPG